MAEPIPVAAERRRLERRVSPTLAELTLPELRRMMVTTLLFVIIVVLFLWMVRTVIIAAIMGVIVSMFMRPIYLWFYKRVPHTIAATTITLAIVIVPVVALTAYSYEEIADVGVYVSDHQDEIATRIDQSLHKLPFMQAANTQNAVKHYVVVASNYGTNVVRSRVPPRYGELSTALETNVRGVLYGAIYSTFLTQAVKSLIIFAMCVAFR